MDGVGHPIIRNRRLRRANTDSPGGDGNACHRRFAYRLSNIQAGRYGDSSAYPISNATVQE